MPVATVAPIQFVVDPYPIVGTPVWDAACKEWVLLDTDGISYSGSTPSECYRQYGAVLHCTALPCTFRRAASAAWRNCAPSGPASPRGCSARHYLPEHRVLSRLLPGGMWL